MEDLRHFVEGTGLMLAAWMAYAWAVVYPFVTGTTALLAMIYSGHAVCRLAWRWWHGYPNFLSEREAEKEKRQ